MRSEILILALLFVVTLALIRLNAVLLYRRRLSLNDSQSSEQLPPMAIMFLQVWRTSWDDTIQIKQFNKELEEILYEAKLSKADKAGHAPQGR